MQERSAVIQYLFNEKFNSSTATMSKATGYPISQINRWINGNTIPNQETLDYIFMCIYTPEFRVVVEFFEIDSAYPIKTQINELYAGHEYRAGVYAFYDAMANLLYVGKASNLLQETYSAIMREDEITFPVGIKNKTLKRHQLVKYISAYEVGPNYHWDYPKHLESLVLRISKPCLNKQIGVLERAYPEEPELRN